VRAIALINSKTHVVSASDDATLRVWDYTTGIPAYLVIHLSHLCCVLGEPLGVLHGHEGKLRCVTTTQDGRYIISGSEDKSVRVWKASSPYSLRHTLVGHTSWVEGLAASPADELIASSANDGDCTIKLWSLGSGHCLKTLVGHKRIVYALAFDSLGEHLVSCSVDKALIVWSTRNGSQLARFTFDDQLCACCFTANGTLLAVGEHSGLLSLLQPIWPTQTTGIRKSSREERIARWS